jgi:DNA-binding XRE family transcriptional regulator
MAAVIEFLGYNPLPVANGTGEQLLRQRTSLGLTQREAAVRIGVDPMTLARWERGENSRGASSWIVSGHSSRRRRRPIRNATSLEPFHAVWMCPGSMVYRTESGHNVLVL